MKKFNNHFDTNNCNVLANQAILVVGGGYPKNVSLICRTGVYTIETHPKIQMPKFLELRELSYMTSAYFWPFLTTPPPVSKCQH